MSGDAWMSQVEWIRADRTVVLLSELTEEELRAIDPTFIADLAAAAAAYPALPSYPAEDRGPVAGQPGIVSAGKAIQAMAPYSRDERPAFYAGDIDAATEDALAVLAQGHRNDDMREFYCHVGTVPMRLLFNPENGLVETEDLTADRLRHRLSELAVWFLTRDKGDKPMPKPGCPKEIVANVLAAPELRPRQDGSGPLPLLRRIVRVPVLDRDGRLIETPGYHEEARLFYEPTPGLVIDPVPERPTPRQIAKAKRLFFGNLVHDFPFKGPAERAHALCLFLQPFVRELIEGPTPLYNVEAPDSRTGKGLLVKAITAVALGEPVKIRTAPPDEAEWRKTLTAALKRTPVYVLFDNLATDVTLKSAVLAALLTSETFGDRELGFTRDLHLPNRAAWIVTGNNPTFSDEIAERMVRIRLDAKMENPGDRTGFKHGDLEGWGRAHRGELIWAALTLARAWVAAGKPPGRGTMGGFEGWTRTMGGILDTCGVPGLLANRDEIRAHNASEQNALATGLALWWKRYGGADVMARDLHPEVLEALGLERLDNHRIGKGLGGFRDKPAGGYVLRRPLRADGKPRVDGATGSALWRVEEA